MHEMTENDSAMYFKKPAWHGLGTVVESATGVTDSLESAGLDWQVYKAPVWANGYVSNNHDAVIRDDTNTILGVVSPTSYKIVQNREVFDIANEFGGDVIVDSAGSVQDGRKLYLLLRGDTFDTGVSYADSITKYMALMWSHDGTQSLTIVPTSIRIVCKNTLDMVIGQARNNANKITIQHSGDIDAKITSARKAIERFKEYGKFFEQKVQSLAYSAPSRSDVNRFFVLTYEEMNKVAIPLNPSTIEEEDAHTKAVLRIAKWTNTFEQEATTCGFSYWTAANAVSDDVQHRPAARGRKKTPASAAYSNLVGKNAQVTRSVFERALELV